MSNSTHNRMIIAIDGPSASGKGTLAKKLAQYFNLPYLNTGALYRLVALRVIEQKIDLQNIDENISNLTQNISENDLENDNLFDEKVGAVASIIAKNSNLRDALFNFQKHFVENGKNTKNGCVLDGRDTTTVICPDADFKFFIKADVEIRAERRFKQLLVNNHQVDYHEILAQLKKRDENDLNRTTSPLKIAEDATIIDNGKLSIEEGFAKALDIINSKNNKYFYV